MQPVRHDGRASPGLLAAPSESGRVRGAFGFDSVQPVVAQLFPTLPNGYNSFY